jgi:hypothetical protein
MRSSVGFERVLAEVEVTDPDVGAVRPLLEGERTRLELPEKVAVLVGHRCGRS